MKQRKKRWLSLVAAPFALAMLAFAQPALANDFNGTCAQYPGTFDGTGNVTINNTGACTLPAVTAGGFIHVTSTGAITAQTLTAGADVDISASSGNVSTQAITSGGPNNVVVKSLAGNLSTGTITSGGHVWGYAPTGSLLVSGNITSSVTNLFGNVLLQAGTTVRAGAIYTSGGTHTGGVQIDANMSGGTSLFTIGSNATNGVTSINTSNTTAGGSNPNYIFGGLQITNSIPGNAGNIRVSSMGAINVAATQSRSGIINLNAQNGTITLPGGTLNANGAAGFGAGQITLLANTVTTVNGTILSANQNNAAAGTTHGVAIAANTINVAGASGLIVRGNGNGAAAGSAYAALLPMGGVTISSNNSYTSMLWTISPFSLSTNGPMIVTGLGSPVTVSANGTNSQVTLSGYPVTFNTGAVTITANGSTANSHNIVLQYTGSFNGVNGLSLSGNGAVTFDASGTSGNNSAGTITVLTDKASINNTVPSLTFNANGVGTGSGALIQFQPTHVTNLDSPTVNFSANGPGGNINFGPRANATTAGDASITSTTFNLTANAPASGTANAGIIYFGTNNFTFGPSTKMKFSAIGPTSGSGNGGNITVFPGNVSGGTLKLGTNSGTLQVLANAGSTGGDGGTININPYPGSISIETANAVSALSSTGASANSKGGSVTLIGNPNVQVASSVTGATINVDGKGTGNGGSIRILGNGTLSLGTSTGAIALTANATGTGDGGSIEIGYTTTLTQSGGVLSASGGSAVGSNGKGGIINIHHLGIGVFSGQLAVEGRGTGNGGSLSIHSNAFNTMNLNSAMLSASADAAGTGNGGSLTVSNQGVVTVSGTTFTARGGQGGTGGDGGQISISTQSTPIDLSAVGFLNASPPKASSKQGGSVTVNKAKNGAGTAAIDVLSLIVVDAGDSAGVSTPGGTIALNSVTCSRKNTGYSTAWPKAYYVCGGANTGWEEAPALEGKNDGQIHSLIKDSTNIFVFPTATSLQEFYAVPISVDFAGATFKNTPGFYIYVNILTPAFSQETFVREAAQHELGHAMEFAYGAATESQDPDFVKFKRNDYQNLDYSVAAATQGASTPRDPCSATPTSATPPFAGVVNAAGVAICGTGTDYTIIPGTSMGILKKYIPNGVLMSNSKIALLESNYVLNSDRETYAQQFAVFRYAVNTLPNSDLYDKTFDRLVHRNYFECTAFWITNAYLNQTRTSAPAYCTATPKTWYLPNQ